MVTDILYLTLERFLGFLPVLVAAIVVGKVLSLYISEDKMGILLKGERRNIMGASL